MIKLNNVFSMDLINCNTKTKIHFDKLIPRSISDTYSANFSSTEILGRSAPVFVYSSGSAQSLSFSLEIHEDMINENILQFVDKIRALSYPVYDDGGIKAPRVYCKIGSAYAFWGTCNVTVTWKGAFRNGHYTVVELGFSMTRIGSVSRDSSVLYSDPVDAYDVEKRGGSRV